MKKRFNLLVTLGLIIFAWSAQAQYDDVYYGGSPIRTKSRAVNHSTYSNNSQDRDDQYLDDQNYTDSDGSYDDQEYNYLDDYDYSYTHRIRRFHRPLIGRSFYDPFYVDPWNFDPYYYSSGYGLITPSLGLGFYSFSDYNRWNRWYHFNQFRYWDPWTYSYWSYDPFSYSRFSNYYWASNSWCPSSWYSNRLYGGSSYWGNSYNGAYQPRYYTNTNVHFGPRTYGATTTGDHGPSRTSSRIFSDPNDKTGIPGLRRSPREGSGTTVVRERDVPVNREGSTVNPDGIRSERISPRASDRSTVRERTNPSSGNDRTFKDYNNGTDQNQSVRPSPRSNDGMRSTESSPRTYNQPQVEQRRFESPRQESPRFESPRQESPRFESPRQESPRFESPRQESPRFESPRQESPRVKNDNEVSSYRQQRSNSFSSPETRYRSVERSTPRNEDSGGRSFSSNSPSRSNSGGSFSGGSSRSGNSPSGGGGSRTSPRNN